jgi:ABC-type amino acid transport system permease subunit
MLSFLIGFSISFVLLWLIFVNIMWAKHNQEKIPKWMHNPIKILAVLGIGYDVLFNWTYGCILFMQLPKKDLPTLTERMKFILITDDGWRFKLAKFICNRLVEPWHPEHCSLGSFRF